MATRAKPLQDRILVRQDDVITHSAGGILLPPAAQEVPRKGTVVEVGPGATDSKGRLVPLTLKAGDKVVFGRYAGVEINLDGVNYSIMREADVACALDGEDDGSVGVGTIKRAHAGVNEHYK